MRALQALHLRWLLWLALRRARRWQRRWGRT
jgi:hypothetical protein